MDAGSLPIYQYAGHQQERTWIILPEEDGVVFLRFRVDTPFNSFELYKNVVEYLLDGDEQNWNFVAIHDIPHADFHLHDQILGIHLASHESFFEVDALCLVALYLQGPHRGTLAFPEVEYKSRYFPLQMDEEHL